MLYITAVYLLFSGYLSTDAYVSAPDSVRTTYVWHTEGIPLYPSPSQLTHPVGQLTYGEEVTITGIAGGEAAGAKIYAHAQIDEMPDGYVKEYVLPAHWVKVEHEGTTRYVPDTYLSGFRAPVHTGDGTFILQDYLQWLSAVTAEAHEGQTGAFCSRSILHFENGITYTFTDFGPCEQCGHGQQQLYLPTATKTEALMMALHFFECYGLFSTGNTVLIKQNSEGVELEGVMEYGQTVMMRIEQQENGVLLIEDMYL